MSGPLTGLRLVEFAGLAAAPYAGMLLSDMGADIVVIDRPGARRPSPHSVIDRNRRRITLDLKNAASLDVLDALFARCEGLFEGYRPGVMERLGIGPAAVLGQHPRMVYGRLTGWGQTGPYATTAGHDINYVAISGALGAIGLTDKPVPALNLIGDMGGGALFLVVGVLSALLNARATGEGQVVDAAMSDGAASLMAMLYGYSAMGRWNDGRRSNRLDGGAHYYDTYECADGGWIAVGAIEPQFHSLLLDALGLADDPLFANQEDPAAWPTMRDRIAARFMRHPRPYWIERMAGSDACCAPILSMAEAPMDSHNRARSTFVDVEGHAHPAPAPRFSRTASAIRSTADKIGTVERLIADWNLPDSVRATIGGASG